MAIVGAPKTTASPAWRKLSLVACPLLSSTPSTSSFSQSRRHRLGMVTPLGCGVETTWKRLIEGDCAIRALTPEDIKMIGFYSDTQSYTFDQLTSKVAAIVPCGSNPGEFNEELWLNSKDHRSMARFIGYAMCAAEEALKDASWIPTEPEERERTILINMASGHISMKYGFQVCEQLSETHSVCYNCYVDNGIKSCCVTACATGARSLGDATRMIQCGDSDVMVARGTESSIDALLLAGFCKSRALTTNNSSPQEASRPLTVVAMGLCQGSGVLVLEELEHAKNRGAKIYAEIRGYGMSGDACQITQPHTDGRGAILAMTHAHRQSGLHPKQVDYVNAHATSTPLGDAIEANAIKNISLTM